MAEIPGAAAATPAAIPGVPPEASARLLALLSAEPAVEEVWLYGSCKVDSSVLLTLRQTWLRLGRGLLRLGGVRGGTAPLLWRTPGELVVSATMAQWGHAAANPVAWLN